MKKKVDPATANDPISKALLAYQLKQEAQKNAQESLQQEPPSGSSSIMSILLQASSAPSCGTLPANPTLGTFESRPVDNFFTGAPQQMEADSRATNGCFPGVAQSRLETCDSNIYSSAAPLCESSQQDPPSGSSSIMSMLLQASSAPSCVSLPANATLSTHESRPVDNFFTGAAQQMEADSRPTNGCFSGVGPSRLETCDGSIYSSAAPLCGSLLPNIQLPNFEGRPNQAIYGMPSLVEPQDESRSNDKLAPLEEEALYYEPSLVEPQDESRSCDKLIPLDEEALFYEPPQFPHLDLPFFSYGLMSPSGQSHQAYSPLGVRQMILSTANCVTPPGCGSQSLFSLSSPLSKLRSAAKSFDGTPSLFRKRRRQVNSGDENSGESRPDASTGARQSTGTGHTSGAGGGLLQAFSAVGTPDDKSSLSFPEEPLVSRVGNDSPWAGALLQSPPSPWRLLDSYGILQHDSVNSTLEVLVYGLYYSAHTLHRHMLFLAFSCLSTHRFAYCLFDESKGLDMLGEDGHLNAMRSLDGNALATYADTNVIQPPKSSGNECPAVQLPCIRNQIDHNNDVKENKSGLDMAEHFGGGALRGWFSVSSEFSWLLETTIWTAAIFEFLHASC